MTPDVQFVFQFHTNLYGPRFVYCHAWTGLGPFIQWRTILMLQKTETFSTSMCFNLKSPYMGVIIRCAYTFGHVVCVRFTVISSQLLLIDQLHCALAWIKVMNQNNFTDLHCAFPLGEKWTQAMTTKCLHCITEPPISHLSVYVLCDIVFDNL